MNLQEWKNLIDSTSDILMVGIMIIQTIVIWAGFWFGKRYLDQHREKISLERKRIAAENALRSLLKVDQILSAMFSGIEIIGTPEYDEIVERTDKELDLFTIVEGQWGRTMVITQRVFKKNFKRLHDTLWEHHRELKLNLLILGIRDHHLAEKEIDLAIDGIVHFMLFEFDSIYNNIDLESDEMEELARRTPMSMNDPEKEVIINYDRAGVKLKDLLLNHCS